MIHVLRYIPIILLPYGADVREYVCAVFGTDRDEIRARGGVVIILQARIFTDILLYTYFFRNKNVPKNTAASTKMMAGPVAMPL